MAKFWVLLKLNFLQMLNSFSGSGGRNKKKKTATGLGGLILLAGLSLYLSALYSSLLAGGLAEVGQLSTLFLLMSVMAVGLGTMFTLFAAQGVVFGGKDNDLMLSMPVDSFTLLLCRVLALYLENLVCTALVLLPAGVVYLINGGTGGGFILVGALLAALFLAFVPTVLSLVLGFFLSWLSSKFRKKALLTNLLYFGSFAVLMVVIFRVSFSSGSGDSQLLLGIEAMFGGWGILFSLTRDAICGSPLALILLAAVCTLPFLLVVWLFSKKYKSILTGLTSQSARSDYKLGTVAATSCRKALLRKESARFFGTPVYFFNAGFGLLMLPVLGVAAVVMKPQIDGLLSMLTAEVGLLPLPLILFAVLGFVLSTVGITASSVSLEGRSLWVLREAPVSDREILAAKAGFQILLCLPFLAVTVVLLWFSFGLTILEGTALLLATLLFSAVVAFLGLLANLRFPKLDAPNDTMVVKNSASALLSMCGELLLLIGAGFLCYLLQAPLGYGGSLLAVSLLLAAVTAALVVLLNTKGRKLFAEL
ncbi:MAG: hypothetical protein RSB55_07895 [Oscillospiraceae bacterium]